MKKLIKFLSLSILILSGCTNTNSNSTTSSTNDVNSTTTSNVTTSSSSSTHSSSNSPISSTIVETPNEDIMYDGYYKATYQSVYFRDVRKSYLFKNDIPSLGDQKLLVVPIKFKDSTYADNELGGTDKVYEDIQKVFFGDPEETGWESVSSYYKKSSYGKLNLTGKVTDWFTLDMNFLEVDALPQEKYIDPTVWIKRQVGKWYLENYDDAQEFVVDQNGYIDSLWMVYDWPSNNDHVIDWAHAYWDYINHEQPSVENPIPYTFAWAGVGFLYEGGYTDENGVTLPDAHTFVHETGHMLGLDDYYDYDSSHSYAGALDMMDHNIGDHTALSKYLLDWVNPYVVTDECEITINSFAETGDCIIIKDDWNHSATDEYLIIEFYTPTGLNAKDAEAPYAGKYPLMYQEPGIKVYHVDARLGYFSNYAFQYYTDEILGDPNSLAFSTKVAHTNSAQTNGADRRFNLYHLLENGGTHNLHGNNKRATDDTLFHKGDRFDPINHEECFFYDEHFNDGEYINYTFKVTEMTDSYATLKFTLLD